MNHSRNKLALFFIAMLMGFCGLAIPGLSSSTIAIIFLVYYDMIYAISHVFSQPKKSLTFLAVLVAGYAAGSLVGAVAVNTVYIAFPVPMVGAVLGFLIGTIPRMTVETRKDFKKPVNILIMVVVAILFLLYTFLVSSKQDLIFEEIRFVDYFILFFVGVVTSTTLVIPGVDFAVTLMALGYYYALINLMGNFVLLITNPARLILFLSYVVGYGVGSFFLSKGLRYLTKRYPRQVHCVNYALVCVAPLIVLKKCVVDNDNFWVHFTGPQMVWAIVLFAAGFFAYTWIPFVLRYVGLLPKNTEAAAAAIEQAAKAAKPVPDADNGDSIAEEACADHTTELTANAEQSIDK